MLLLVQLFRPRRERRQVTNDVCHYLEIICEWLLRRGAKAHIGRSSSCSRNYFKILFAMSRCAFVVVCDQHNLRRFGRRAVCRLKWIFTGFHMCGRGVLEFHFQQMCENAGVVATEQDLHLQSLSDFQPHLDCSNTAFRDLPALLFLQGLSLYVCASYVRACLVLTN